MEIGTNITLLQSRFNAKLWFLFLGDLPFFWVICLLAVYGMYWKSHLLPLSCTQFDPSKQLSKEDFWFFCWEILVTIHWRKAIQFREWVVELPLPPIPGSKLYPNLAITHAFSLTNTPASSSQAFSWVEKLSLPPQVFMYNTFLTKLRDHLTCTGINPQSYAGHSFCKGRASFAYQLGVPIELIKALRDWCSNTILNYLTIPLTIRLNLPRCFANPLSLTPLNFILVTLSHSTWVWAIVLDRVLNVYVRIGYMFFQWHFIIKTTRTPTLCMGCGLGGYWSLVISLPN